MHEMSIAMSLLEMAESEAARLNCSRILAVTVQYGQISGIMPDALRLAFDALVHNTPHMGCRLELVRLPLRLRCPFCNAVFSGADDTAIFQPCPACGEDFGHIVEQGKELLLARVEAE